MFEVSLDRSVPDTADAADENRHPGERLFLAHARAAISIVRVAVVACLLGVHEPVAAERLLDLGIFVADLLLVLVDHVVLIDVVDDAYLFFTETGLLFDQIGSRVTARHGEYGKKANENDRRGRPAVRRSLGLHVTDVAEEVNT